jgi:hypothetical protein
LPSAIALNAAITYGLFTSGAAPLSPVEIELVSLAAQSNFYGHSRAILCQGAERAARAR